MLTKISFLSVKHHKLQWNVKLKKKKRNNYKEKCSIILRLIVQTKQFQIFYFAKKYILEIERLNCKI